MVCIGLLVNDFTECPETLALNQAGALADQDITGLMYSVNFNSGEITDMINGEGLIKVLDSEEAIGTDTFIALEVQKLDSILISRLVVGEEEVIPEAQCFDGFISCSPVVASSQEGEGPFETSFSQREYI